MLLGYARVSTDLQDHALQLDALRAVGCDKVFVETGSVHGLIGWSLQSTRTRPPGRCAGGLASRSTCTGCGI